MDIKAVAYCRVSTPGQVGEDKFGIDAQKEQIKQYCDEKNIEIVAWYIDEGISGAEKDRPALNQLFDGCETNPPVQYIVVAKADRLARDIMLYFAFKFHFEQMGLSILSVSEDWSERDKLTAMVLETFTAMVAEVEKDNIRNRMDSGRRQKSKRGGYSGGSCPYGYKPENGRMVIDEDAAELVRYMFKLKSTGMSTLGVTKKINEEGYRTAKGKEFCYSTVQSILSNERTYRGEYKYGKDGKWVKGEHAPILDNTIYLETPKM